MKNLVSKEQVREVLENKDSFVFEIAKSINNTLCEISKRDNGVSQSKVLEIVADEVKDKDITAAQLMVLTMGTFLMGDM